jgi:hypothetical protein
LFHTFRSCSGLTQISILTSLPPDCSSENSITAKIYRICFPSRKADPLSTAIADHRNLDRRAWGGPDGLDTARAREAEVQAAWKLAHARPTTISGGVELLQYALLGPTSGLFTLGELAWQETAVRTALAALSKMV